VPADEAERRAASKSGGEDGRPPLLFRTYKLKAAILHPYR
jgi:mixed-linked glucan synthase